LLQELKAAPSRRTLWISTAPPQVSFLTSNSERFRTSMKNKKIVLYRSQNTACTQK
jgi:hypothetical protein